MIEMGVITASEIKIKWAIGVLDQVSDGQDVDADTFFGANAVLTAVAYSALQQSEEIDSLKLRNAQSLEILDVCLEFIDYLLGELEITEESNPEIAQTLARIRGKVQRFREGESGDEHQAA